MPPRKRKIVEDEPVIEPTKYAAGKVPRADNNPPIDYTEPLNPESELFKDEWSIPKFNMFVNYTLDHLSETYKNIFKDFIKLPSRKFHPQYYYKIEQPISVNEIKTRDYEYPDGPRDFLLDVELLAKNCISYNEIDSLIVKNALQMINFIEYETLKAKNVKRNYVITEEIKVKLLGVLNKLFDATAKVINDTVPDIKTGLTDNNDDEFKLSEPFLELVDKDDLPEYYEVIHRPMSLLVIKQNLEVGYYSKIYDLVPDVELVFDNSFIFNDSTSLIYQTAKALLDYFNYIIQNEFFKELIDLSERGELNLEYDKYEFEKYMGTVRVENPTILPEESDDELDNFNHVEGLGNGYTRNLLNDDYLLDPNYQNTKENKKFNASVGNVEIGNKVNKQAEILKFNIVKSINKETVSEQFTMEEKPYDMINEISIFTSKNLYNQGINPMPGSRPSVSQNWLEYNFIGADLNQNENMFSLSLEPTHNFLTMVSRLNESNLKSTLYLNNDTIRPRKDTKRQKEQQQHNQEEQKIDTSEENEIEPERFDIHLNEGLNLVEFKCQVEEENIELQSSSPIETMKFWINVLP